MFRRKRKAEREELDERMTRIEDDLASREEKHKEEVDERVERVEAEVRALSSYVGKQPDLREVVNES